MPVTLAQAALNSTSALDLSVINEFRANALLDLVTFDDAVSPVGGGGTLTYSYTRQLTQPQAAFRAINTEYTPSEVTRARYSVDLKPLGGSFQLDRVLARVGPAATNDMALQMSEKIRATQAKFGDAVINGDTAVDANGFDGLSKALAGSGTQEFTAVADISGTQDMTWAFRVLTIVDDLLSAVPEGANALIGNTRVVNLIKAAARFSSAYVREPGPRSTYVDSYAGMRLLDAGKKIDGTTDVIPFNATDPDSAGPLVAGSTSLYAVRFGLDAFHGVSMAGGPLVQTWLPDFSTPGAVKTGEVEMGPVGVVLKRTRGAAVHRNIKVA